MSDFRGNNAFSGSDVLERIEELESEIEEAFTDWWERRINETGEDSSLQESFRDEFLDSSPALEDQVEELKQLKEIAENVSLKYGPTFTKDSYFTVDYARQTAEDTCNVDFNSWPCNCIDWEEAAEALQADYSSIELNGDTYYYQE